MMLIIWTFLLLTSISCYGVTETQEEIDNITTLYPVANNTSDLVTSNQGSGDHGTSTHVTGDHGTRKQAPGDHATSNHVTSNHDTSNHITSNHGTRKQATGDHATNNSSNQTDSLKMGTSVSETLNNDSNNMESKEEPVIEKPGNDSKEFRPSVHFQDFFDEDDFGLVPLPTKPTVDAFAPLKKPPSAFIGSHKDDFKSIHKSKPPLERFPYKFEDAILTRAKPKWRPTGLESRPTVPVPAQVPAGGLYKKPDVFKEKPSITDDEDFGLTFTDDKEKFVKKRPNPWKSLVHLLTAFIPVGLIISALTPNVVTIQGTGHGPGLGPVGPGIRPVESGIRPIGPGVSGIEPLPPRLFRRSDEVLDPLPPPPATPPPAISEPCRRRLLCELHSEKNYNYNQSYSQKKVGQRGRACHKLPCEEPDALAQTLHWLLHRPPAHNRFS